MNGVLMLCVQDFKRLLSNALFWVLTVSLAAIVLVVNFALPSKMDIGTKSVVTYGFESQKLPLESLGSVDDVISSVKVNSSVGIVNEKGKITVYNPNLSQKAITAIVAGILPTSEHEKVMIESIEGFSEPVPFNKHTVPIFICFEALVIGFILGGALMLSEKETAVVKAMRVAPMGVFRYIFAKVILFSAVGAIYGTLMCVLTIGFEINWVLFLAITITGTTVFTLLGLGLTSFFKDMSSWFFAMSLILSINMLPSLSYSSPSFSPAFLDFIPSHALLFAYDGAIFGGSVYVLFTAFSVIAWLLLSYVIAHSAIKNIFLKGAVAL